MANAKKVRKAVISAAGFGTRFLPQTKSVPKEMLPIIDKPIIQYIVEELVEAGIEDIIIVTGYGKNSIENHFDNPSSDLVKNLQQNGKEELLKEIESVAELANFIYVRQKGVYGTGTPLLNTEHLIGDEPFIYTWGDDFIGATPPRFKQLIDFYEQYQAPIMASIKARDDKDYDKFGFISGNEEKPGAWKIDSFVEKPGKQNSPSNIATVSGYILTPQIFKYLHIAREKLQPNREFYYQDALELMLKDKLPIYACEIKNGKYYDAGNKLEYLKTVVEFGLKRDDIGEEFKAYLRQLPL